MSLVNIRRGNTPILMGATLRCFKTTNKNVLKIVIVFTYLAADINLTTSYTTCFGLLLPGVSSGAFIAIVIIIYFFITLFNLAAVVGGTIPMLLFLCPVSVSLVTLTFLRGFFGNHHYMCM